MSILPQLRISFVTGKLLYYVTNSLQIGSIDWDQNIRQKLATTWEKNKSSIFTRVSVT